MLAAARGFALILAAGLGFGSALAGTPRYMVEMELWIDGEQRGTPMLIVEAGKPAELVSTDPDGNNGWKIELEVESPGLAENAPSGAIWLHLAVAELVSGEWEHLTDALLGVPEGQSSSLSLLDGEGEAGGPDGSRVYLTARSSRLRPDEG